MEPLERLADKIREGEESAEDLLAKMVMDHARSEAIAGVHAKDAVSLAGTLRIKAGECYFCGSDSQPLLCEFKDTLNGSKRKVLQHAHFDPNPHCTVCYDGSGYETEHADWPCPFLREVAEAYGVEL